MKKAQRAPLFIRTMIWMLVVTTFVMAWVPPEGTAMLAPATTSGAGSDPSRAEDLQSIQRVLENKLIQQRLEDFGLTSEEINDKMNRLSDAQLHQMAAQIDALMPGGDVGLITVLVVLLIVLIIVILI